MVDETPKGDVMVWTHILLERRTWGTVILGFSSFLAWIASINWTGVATTFVAVSTIVAMGFVTIRARFREDQKQWEINNKDSLIFQLNHTRERHEWTTRQNDELRKNIESLRDSILKQREELEQRSAHLFDDNLELRKKLDEATDRLMNTSRLLNESNVRIVFLSSEIERFRVGVAVDKKRAVRDQDEVMKHLDAITDSVDEIATNTSRADDPVS